jgi:hypothetical protein
MPLTPAERSLRGQMAVNISWARTPDREARTANARKAFDEKFEREVAPEGTLPAAERAKRAENLRKAYFQGLALKSSQARRRGGSGAA